MNHTPGPWVVEGLPGHVVVRRASRGFRSVEGMSGRPVVRMIRDNSNEGIANARLIAAAPALLDALQALESSMTMHDGGDVFGRAAGTWSIEARAKARAAVAAARGV